MVALASGALCNGLSKININILLFENPTRDKCATNKSKSIRCLFAKQFSNIHDSTVTVLVTCVIDGRCRFIWGFRRVFCGTDIANLSNGLVGLVTDCLTFAPTTRKLVGRPSRPTTSGNHISKWDVLVSMTWRDRSQFSAPCGICVFTRYRREIVTGRSFVYP